MIAVPADFYRFPLVRLDTRVIITAAAIGALDAVPADAIRKMLARAGQYRESILNDR